MCYVHRYRCFQQQYDSVKQRCFVGHFLFFQSSSIVVVVRFLSSSLLSILHWLLVLLLRGSAPSISYTSQCTKSMPVASPIPVCFRVRVRPLFNMLVTTRTLRLAILLAEEQWRKQTRIISSKDRKRNLVEGAHRQSIALNEESSIGKGAKGRLHAVFSRYDLLH